MMRLSISIISVAILFNLSSCKEDADMPLTSEFTLHVSNQSFNIDPVDIKISIDGEVCVDEDFFVENQHNWKMFKINLELGTHTLLAETVAGDTTLQTEFELTLDKHYGVVDFWYYPNGSIDPTPPQFSFHFSDDPFMFD